MKVVIIGGVAGGASAAARLRRLNEDAEIIILERSGYVSYANCGLPYYVGGTIEEEAALTLQTPESFWNRFHIQVRVNHEVVKINREEKLVEVHNLLDHISYQESYDKLVLCPGAKAIIPPFLGEKRDNIYTLRTVEDAQALRRVITEKQPKSAVIVGAGFIGLEMAENFVDAGVFVSMVEKSNQVMPPLDYDMSCEAAQHVRNAGVDLHLNCGVTGFSWENQQITASLEDGNKITADMVILAIGVVPDSHLAKDCGLTMGQRGSILVNEHMQTSDENIYAAGDAVEITNFITKQRALVSLAGPANKEGRIIADNLCGIPSVYEGAQGSSVLKLFDTTVASTGLNERAAKEAGIDYEAVVTTSASHATYYPGAENMTVKTIFEKKSGKLLGAQLIGASGVDKRIDVLATAIYAGLTSQDLCRLDLSYAPPYSSAKDPVNMAGFIMENIRGGLVLQYHWQEVEELTHREDVTLLDVRRPEEYALGHMENAMNIPLDTLRDHLDQLDINKPVYINCHSGLRSYIACRILSQKGYTCYNFSGGYRFYELVMGGLCDNTPVMPCGISITQAVTEAKLENETQPEANPVTVSAEDIKRVKGMGFLHAKGTNQFNGRVITRNGKITNEEMAAITKAAAMYGDGEVAMTTRLTMEVQGIPYENIEAFQEEIGKAGLVTGGTGSRVRPVVSCKGTTCQYGLIDSFALSSIIHERFYNGYHDVSLPHKFKIAVGGCPNNCVKPDLNDIGIIGQRVPVLDEELCKGCKVCAVEKACPVHMAVKEGDKLKFQEDCNHCGRCIGKCPFKAVKEEIHGYKVYIGGRWGKKVAQGEALRKIFTTQEEVLDVVEKAILLFREQGISGERFSDTIARIGFENAEAQLIGHELLERKDKILGLNVTGGASC